MPGSIIPPSYIEIKKKQLAKQGRNFSNIDNGLFYYSKEGRGKNLNGKAHDAFGEEIVCRHLVWQAALMELKDYHSKFSSAKKLEKLQTLKSNKWDRAFEKRYFSEFLVYHVNEFGSFLEKKAKKLIKDEKKIYCISSENHMMALSLQLKSYTNQSYFVLKLYEPNVTDKHVRGVFENSKDFLALRLFHIRPYLSIFFPKINAMAIFSTTEVQTTKEVSWSLSNACLPEERLFFALHYGNEDSQKQALSFVLDSDWQREQKLNVLMKKDASGNPLWFSPRFSTLAYSLDCIMCSSLDLEDQFRVILNVDQSGKSLFSCYLRWSQDTARKRELIHQYLSMILSSSHTETEKISRLMEPKFEHNNLLFWAFLMDNGLIIDTYVDVISSDSLSPGIKIQALMASNKDGCPAVYNGMYNDYSDSITVFFKKIINSDLDSQVKFKLFQALKNNDYPCLFVAMSYNHRSSVFIYATLVFDANFPEEIVLSLLTSKDAEGVSAISNAFDEGHYGLICDYLDFVFQSNLTLASKTNFLSESLIVCSRLILKAMEANLADIVSKYTLMIFDAVMPFEETAKLLKLPTNLSLIELGLKSKSFKSIDAFCNGYFQHADTKSERHIRLLLLAMDLRYFNFLLSNRGSNLLEFHHYLDNILTADFENKQIVLYWINYFLRNSINNETPYSDKNLKDYVNKLVSSSMTSEEKIFSLNDLSNQLADLLNSSDLGELLISTILSSWQASKQGRELILSLDSCLAWIRQNYLDEDKVSSYIKLVCLSALNLRDKYLLLQYVKEEGDVILTLVRSNSKALSFASGSLKANKAFVKLCVLINGLSLRFAHLSLQEDSELVLLAIKQNPHAIRHASDTLKLSANFLEVALSQTPSVERTLKSDSFGRFFKKHGALPMILSKPAHLFSELPVFTNLIPN